MKIRPTKINRGDLIRVRDIPTGTEKCAMVTYAGRSVLVPVDYIEDGRYRLEFIRQHGIPLPPTKVSSGLTEFFCPNLNLILE